jgi:glycosyltransferase involved in cell wall biosynthesis
MVLAHNEEKHIIGCLRSIVEGQPRGKLEVYVMANGCTDRTEALTRAFAEEHPEVRLVTIALGDKCNAWNVFIHETVPAHCRGRAVYFFMDGDARCVPGSLDAMARALAREAHAHAASAPPASGRNAEHDARELLGERGLVANLYALRGKFVERLIALDVRLPLGLEGDDGLLGALVKWDLAPDQRQFDHARIVPCPEAGFAFDQVPLTDPSAWRTYWRRAVRYGRRAYEFELLGPRLKDEGLAALPVDIRSLYVDAMRLGLRWNGLYTISNLVALREMRRIARSGSVRVPAGTGPSSNL